MNDFNFISIYTVIDAILCEYNNIDLIKSYVYINDLYSIIKGFFKL